MRTVIVVLLFIVPSMRTVQAQTTLLDSLTDKLQATTHDDTTKVVLLNTLGGHVYGSDPTKSREYFLQALGLAQKLRYHNGIADAYRGISLAYFTQTDSGKSMYYALLALKEYEQCRLSEGISWAYRMIGLSYLLELNLDKAGYYLKQALALNEKTGNKKGIAKDLLNIGLVSESRKAYDTALYYYKKSLRLQEEVGTPSDRTLCYNNIGSIYTLQGNYPLALRYLEQALALAEGVDHKDFIALVHQNLGDVYCRIGRYEESEKHLNTALRVALEIGNKKRREQTYDVLTELEVSRKNYEAAFRYLKNSKQLKDTLHSEERYKQVSELEARYETEKKEKEIQLLEQTAAMQALWQNSLIVVLVLTMAGAIIIYYLQKSRVRKARQLLDIQKTLNRKMQELDRSKSFFFANISHEFRTPLTLILTPLEEKLMAEDLSPKDRITFQSIRRSANRLLELINQLLELSKLESGHMKIQLQATDLGSFIWPVVTAFDSLAEVNTIRYTKQINLPPITALFDADKVEKILNNLLSNAFKFSPASGSIVVSVSAIEKGSVVELMIGIRNTGPVIPPDMLVRIFDPYVQGKDASPYGMAGTGLGLSLVKELVKLHSGDIRVSSDAVEGTLFSVSLMLEKALPHIEAVASAKADASIDGGAEDIPVFVEKPDQETILLVEDNPDVRALIRSNLLGQYRVREAAAGDDGLKLAQEEEIDLVVSDVMMPGMNGVDFCRQLKNDERTSHIPVILLTARADMESKLEGLSTGADDYMVKPFHGQELSVRIVNLLERRRRLAKKYQQRTVIHPHDITVTPLDEIFIQKVIQIVDNNLANTNFSLENIVEELGMSRSNILRKLKSITGLSTSEFIRDYRLRRAALLIEKRADTISNIAYKVGFDDQSYFSKCFKKKFAKTPTEFAQHNASPLRVVLDVSNDS